MGFFDGLFRKKSSVDLSENQNNSQSEQAVIIQFTYTFQSMDPIYNLGARLEETLLENNIGEYDGHEIAVDYSHGFLYLYGPNAEILFKGIRPILKDSDFLQGAIAKLRFGPPENGVKEIEVEI